MSLNDDAQTWVPSPESILESNIGRLMAEIGIGNYDGLHRWSVENREEFWRVMIEKLGIQFKTRPHRVMDASKGAEYVEWLEGAQLNIVDSCFKADLDKIAVYERNEGSSDIRIITYDELLKFTNRVANGIQELGFGVGDAIAIDMPMNYESVAIYLGIIKAGYTVVSIADSFSPKEIAKRLNISGAKAIFTMDHYMRGGKIIGIYQKIKEANSPQAIVLPFGNAKDVSLRPKDILWENFLSENDEFTSIGRKPGDYTNILFSSGTTADPKAIPWTQTTPIKCGADAYLHHDTQESSVLAWPTNLGWMMGPWLIYAGLMNNASIALYNGAPTTKEFGKFVSDAKVTMLGVIPSLVKVWRETGCMESLDWGNIRLFSSTGECSNRDDYWYLMQLAGNKPVIEYCGGTEIGGGYITGTVVQQAIPSAFSTPTLGLDVIILDENGNRSSIGEMFLVPPSIGLSARLFNQDHHAVYFEGCPKGPNGETLRRHGDEMEQLVGGYFVAHGRADDTMNLGGIKTSSAAIERALLSSPYIHETAAIAVPPPEGGAAMLVIYAVLKGDVGCDGLKDSLQQTIRQELNPLFKIYDVVPIDNLPRTASNKVMRRTLRDAYTRERMVYSESS